MPKGSFIGITGNNGSGKSTLINFMGGTIPHHISGFLKGEIWIDNINTKTSSISELAKKWV